MTLLNASVKKVEADYYTYDDNQQIHFWKDNPDTPYQSIASGIWVFVEPFDPKIHKDMSEPEEEKKSSLIEIYQGNMDN